MTPLLLALSALGVGFIHSLAPGHWLPVVLVAKSRRWTLSETLLGAWVAASGHVLISAAVALGCVFAGNQLLTNHEELIESYAGLGMALFGAIYAILAWRNHAHCHGHGHHGPAPASRKRPYWFLFSVGFSPCVAVLPILFGASAYGMGVLAMALGGFVVGVLVAFTGAALGVSRGLVHLDHPWLDHHGDLITGLAVMVLGVAVWALH